MLLDLAHSKPARTVGKPAAAIAEARRQIEICNACRYCEGFCSVFPAMTRDKMFSDGNITHLANLCHNCRGCFYSCQYTEPHEFALNVPAALAEVRQDRWERLVWPAGFAKAFQSNGVAIAAALVAGIAALFTLIFALPEGDGAGFYAHLGHSVMLAIFIPAFGLPLLALVIGLQRYWRETGAGRLTARDIGRALDKAATLRNLSGGQSQGCNFEGEDRYSDYRRWFHQLVLYGFLACFAATSVASLMHYLLDWRAPYGLFTPPKLLGIPGGIALVIGTAGLAWLKTQADPKLGAVRVWGGEMAFILLLCLLGLSGLVLYAASGTAAVPPLLAIHLGGVLAFFLLMPYTKMVHGFFRVTALLAEETKRR